MSRSNSIALSGVCLTALVSVSGCQSECVTADVHGLELERTIQVPGQPLGAFDVSWVDPFTQRYYLADRANSGVEIVDAAKGTYIGRVDGFAGSEDHDHSGPNGVLVIPGANQLWAADGDSSVQIIDLATQEREHVSTGGSARADELSYDPDDQVLLVVNNAEEIGEAASSGPFATLISTRADHRVLARITFHEASAGLEQSVWEPESGLFYLAIPELHGDAAAGGVAVIDPRKLTLEKIYPVSECQPAGVALGPRREILLGCSGDAIEAGFAAKSLILDTRTGAVVKTIAEVGGSDEVWWNPGDERYYLAARDNPSGPVLGVIDSRTNTWQANIPTGDDSKSVAVDPVNNKIFVGLTPTKAAFANDAQRRLQCENGCIGVFAYAGADACGLDVPALVPGLLSNHAQHSHR